MRLGCEEHQAAAMRALTVGNQGVSPGFGSWGTLEEPCVGAAEGRHFGFRGPPEASWSHLVHSHNKNFIVNGGF